MFSYSKASSEKNKLPPLWNGVIAELTLDGIPIRDVIRNVFKSKKCRQMYVKIPVNCSLSPFVEAYKGLIGREADMSGLIKNERFVLIKDFKVK